MRDRQVSSGPETEVELRFFEDAVNARTVYLYECYRCHALYLNAAEHRAWHAALTADLQQAARGSEAVDGV